jgi:thymidylate synthase
MANTKTIKNQYEVDYRKILKEALAKGVTRKDRTGVGCKSIFSKNLRINVSKTFPMITGRKMFEKTFKTEFEWFVNGETNIKRFQEAGIKIWDAWADENGDLGPNLAKCNIATFSSKCFGNMYTSLL